MNKDNIVYSSLDFMEATTVKSLLEGSGITVHMYDENISRMNPIYSHMVGGIKLLVPDDDVERARELLKEYREGSAGNYTEDEETR